MEDSPEEWKPVVGYDGLYDVSNWGRIRIMHRRFPTRVGTYLKPVFNERGYPVVSLYKDKVQKIRMVHLVVTEAFLGPTPPGMQVNHKDSDKRNAALSNLEFATPKENIQHALASGVQFGKPWKLAPAQVLVIREMKGKVRQRDLAAMFGIHRSTVRRVQNRDMWRLLREPT